MATIPIIGKVTVGGTAKTISGGYVNIGGVWKPIVKTYVNVNGVWKNAWKELYTWKKYTVKTSTAYVQEKTAETLTDDDLPSYNSVFAGDSYTFDASTGKYTIKNRATTTPDKLNTITRKYFSRSSSSTATYMYEFIENSGSDWIPEYSVYLYTSKETTVNSQGTYVSDVTSENSSAYPTNGRHSDGYWYVKQ